MKAIHLLLYLAVIFLFISQIELKVSANVIISEIMYNPNGSDKNNEWIEVQNTGNDVNLTKFYFYEQETNHRLKFIQGKEIISNGECAVISQDWSSFLAKNPNFRGNLFDSSWSSLKNSGETLGIKDKNKKIIDIINYTNLAQEGKALCRENNNFKECEPSPGIPNKIFAENKSKYKKEETVQNKGTYPQKQQFQDKNSCDFEVEIAGPEVVQNNKNFNYEIVVSNKACKKTKYSYKARTTIEDFFGNIYSDKILKGEVLCSESRTYDQNFKINGKINAYRIRTAILEENCSDKDMENNMAVKTIVVKNNNFADKKTKTDLKNNKYDEETEQKIAEFEHQKPIPTGNFIKKSLLEIVNFFKRIFGIK